jgi:hypothetical protein
MSSPGPGLFRPLSRFWIAAPALDTLYPLGIDAGLEQFGVELAPGQEAFVMHPFYGRSFVASGGTPLRIAIATNPEYRIEWWTPTGTLERVITRPGARLAPTDADRAGAVASLEKQYEQVDPSVRRTLLAAIPTPDSLPAVYGMVITPRGELLVQRSGILRTQPISTWDVFAADGAFLGEIRIPGHLRLIEAGEDHLLAMRRTEDDAWLVEVYGLRRWGGRRRGEGRGGGCAAWAGGVILREARVVDFAQDDRGGAAPPEDATGVMTIHHPFHPIDHPSSIIDHRSPFSRREWLPCPPTPPPASRIASSTTSAIGRAIRRACSRCSNA